MPDFTVCFVVTEDEQRRLNRLRFAVPRFGQDPHGLIEDVIARKAWDALPKDANG